MTHRAALGLLLLTLASGCAATTEEEEGVEAAEAALVGVPAGTFAIERKPLSGSYVARLNLEAGNAFEIEYVSRRTVYETTIWSPWIPVPTTKEEAVVYRGKWRTFAGDPGETLITFDVTDGFSERFIFSIEASSESAITLKAIGRDAITLKKTSAAPAATDARILTCEARMFHATIALDQAQRRRGTLSVSPKPGAGRGDPPKGDTTVVYTGNTGVEDYMRYEGRDSAGNTYSFALKKSDLERTSGPISRVGLGFGPNDFLAGGAEIHNTLTCTIARP
ncbi:MAG: hypothetical protein KIT84_43995 [Labilithrix sp.]|nr:hypothetical protein [Labilithrix sp.]MCW5818041.1 hypothetical protein [Labilithrix sp.]